MGDLEQSWSSASHITTCDVLVVGGGIAGIAIAERLAREANRQGIHLQIMLVEKEKQLATKASSGLEGWYHTGILYAKLPDRRFLTDCLNSYEDLYNWYCADDAFIKHENCNLRKLEGGSSGGYVRPAAAQSDAVEPKLFLNQIVYSLVPPDYLQSRYSKDWELVVNRIRSITRYLENESWCRGKLSESSTVLLCEVPEISYELYNPTSAVQGSTAIDTLVSSVQDTLTGLEANALQRPFVSTDAAMNARQILWDLVVSARVHHVQFRTGYELGEKSVLTDATQPGRILGVTLRSRHGGQPDLYVTAEQYIFALGAGIEDTRLRAQIRMDVKTQKRKSVVVAVAPSPLDREAAHAGPLSVVWMGYGQSADFNVIAHRGLPKTPNESYCLISDSNSLPADASYEECAEVANRLIAKAAQYLKGVGTPGPADNLDRKMVSILFERTASWYVCEKNEVLFNERVGKEYSYWFGPSRFQWEANSWRDHRKANPQRTTQDELRVITLSAEKDKDSRHLLLSKQRNLPGPILGSIWATKKVLHFAAYRLLAGDLNVKEFKTFRDGLVRQLDEIFQRDRGWIDGLPEEERESIRVIDRNPASKENYLCIVPGKFSLFPTVAHQVYLEMEVRTLYTGEKSPAKPREQVANARKDADGLVGASKGVEALLRRKPQAH